MASIVFAFFLMIGLGCGMFGGEDDSAQSSASALPAQPTPDLEKTVEPTVTEVYEETSAEGYTASDALDVHESSAEAPLLPNVDVHEDESVPPKHTPTELGAIWEAWEQLFVEREKLDPGLATEFEGIGAYIEMNARGHLVILSPMEGGPADLAGIRTGDIILEVDGESLEGLSTLEAVSKIRGPKDSIARLMVKKMGQVEPVVIEVTRAVISL